MATQDNRYKPKRLEVRPNPECPPNIEILNAYISSFRVLVQEQPGDEKSADDEEHIDTEPGISNTGRQPAGQMPARGKVAAPWPIRTNVIERARNPSSDGIRLFGGFNFSPQ